jgi:transposase
VDAPSDGIATLQSDISRGHIKAGAFMQEITIVGLDLEKRVFQVLGAKADGGVAFLQKLSRGQLLAFSAGLPRRVVTMGSCATAHYWARKIGGLGHTVRLMPPAYVKPFVTRQKNDAADSEIIAEAAARPTMHFVEPKSPQQQANAMAFLTRDLFVRQRTQLINALCANLAEHGIIASNRLWNLSGIRQLLYEAGDDCSAVLVDIEVLAVETEKVYFEQIGYA